VKDLVKVGGKYEGYLPIFQGDNASCKVASGFIQAYRLSNKIIEHRGDNSFLSGSSGGIRTGVSKDFVPTDKGLERKDGSILCAPPVSI